MRREDIVDYILEHRDAHADADLRHALLEHGVPAADVEAAFRAVNATDPLAPAGFWVRGGAMLFDGVLTGIPGAVLDSQAASLLLYLALATLCVGRWGRTPGKWAAGLEVLGPDDAAVGYGRALWRVLATFLSGLPFGLGYAAAGMNANKRALHDVLAGTRVACVPGVGRARRALAAVCGVVFAAALSGAAGFAVHDGLERRAAPERLETVRAALKSYARDHQDTYPPDLDALVPDYLSALPELRVGPHPPTRTVTLYGPEWCQGGQVYEDSTADTGGWAYYAGHDRACAGMLVIDCVH